MRPRLSGLTLARLVLVLLFGFLGAFGLVRPARAEKVTFTFRPPADLAVQSVSLRGSMNNWGEAPMAKQADGSWSVTVDLPPGEYQYKFFWNGQWPKSMQTDLKGGPVDAEAESYVDDTVGGMNAVRTVAGAAPAGAAASDLPRAAAPPLAEGKARVHYFRPDAQYTGWMLHVWEDAQESVTWAAGLPLGGVDDFGAWWDVRLKPGAAKLGFIVHKGDTKDPGDDMFIDPSKNREAWVVSGRKTLYTNAPDVGGLGAGDLTRAKAHWLRRDLVAWPGRAPSGAVFQLHAAPQGGLKPAATGVTGGEALALTIDAAGLPADVLAERPQLAGMTALRLSAADAARVPALLKGQVAVSLSGPEGRVRDSSGLQLAGVLDDLFYFDGPLGVTWAGGVPTVRVWAPTAQSVSLLLFDDANAPAPAQSLPMTEEGGAWRLSGSADWKGRYYLYEVRVFVPATGKVETNRVTDPYSRSLARNSTRSQVIDLADPATAPAGWAALTLPPLAAPEDITIYELHVRDFSALDPGVPQEQRGTYQAFTLDTPATRHLRALGKAGLTHIHLQPVFDLATIDEDRAHWKEPGDLTPFPPDGEQQQAAVAGVRDADGYNWGYDPWHYGVPEGSYAVSAEGTARVKEFRAMVQALAGMGLSTVVDVVYNHTNGSGQARTSVLDRIVPGYYHRLSADGGVETSTCCENTASENRMMEKLIVDDVVHWARDYKVRGFRFDLLGHHMKRNLEKVRDALAALTPEKDGIDGQSIYVYGEGWDFGEVQGGKRGANATQKNMAGTGIGTFNDRIRDAIRGGNPFGDRREQGFATGLWDDPNGFQGAGPAERDKLAEAMDRLKIGLAGNLRGYSFPSRTGQPITGGMMSYGGYTDDPQETINYAAAHDNETFYDKIAYAAPSALPLAERVRMAMLAESLVGLGQGVPFFLAGDELLRTKSMDSDSYNSGDWFNRLDFSMESNHWGMGLPVADKNRDRWGTIRPLLARADLRAGRAELEAATAHFEEVLALRRMSPLFRLRTAADIQARLSFPVPSGQQPGVITLQLSDEVAGQPDLDPALKTIVVIFNATKSEQKVKGDAWKNAGYALAPLQAASADARVRTARYEAGSGQFVVPARTTAVFVR